MLSSIMLGVPLPSLQASSYINMSCHTTHQKLKMPVQTWKRDGKLPYHLRMEAQQKFKPTTSRQTWGKRNSLALFVTRGQMWQLLCFTGAWSLMSQLSYPKESQTWSVCRGRAFIEHHEWLMGDDALPLRTQTSWWRCPDGVVGSTVLRKALSSPEVVVWQLLRRNARPYRVFIATMSSASVI